MISLYGSMMNLVFKCMPQDKPGQEHDYAAERKRNDRKPPRAPRGVTVKQITLGGLSGESIKGTGNRKGTVFYFHGGGFTTGSARERRGICQYVASRFGYDCVTFNYRLAPENGWPAPLEDALSAYHGLLELGTDPKNIVFMGESAGGTLVLSLALTLKEKHYPLPKALIALSPSVTAAETLPSHTANIGTDYMLRNSVAEGKIRIVYREECNNQVFLRRPEVSPLYGNYEGLPPVLLSVSDTEVLLDDARFLFRKLKEEGHPAVLNTEHGVCHAFQVFTDMPEARHALNELFGKLEEIHGQTGAKSYPPPA